MAEFPYTVVGNNLKRFLQHIQSAGVPAKVTNAYLESVGFKSTNDRAIIGVLKFIGFVESSGAPSAAWISFRSTSDGRVILAKALREAYSDLFATYPDAYRRDAEALRNYFSTHTKLGDRALTSVVQTFKTLCEMADFDPEIDEPPAAPNKSIAEV